MFQKMQNLETAFQSIRLFTVVVVIGSILLSGFAVYRSMELAAVTQNKTYVLVNGKALEAYAADRKDNLPVEARDHIRTFHQYFFSLTPDDAAIQENIKRALYLADGSAKQAYNDLTEANYYSSIISGNVTQSITVDSIKLDMNVQPYYFRCYCTQKITRPTTVAIRSLVTEGYLRDVARSENNSHGLLIERWSTIENKDLSIKSRNL